MRFFNRFFSIEKFMIIHSDNVEDAKIKFEAFEPFDLIFLDHDLGGEVYVNSEEKNTGNQFAKWLCQCKNLKNTQIIIHSLNYYGVQNMKNFLPKAIDIPFPILVNELITKKIIIE